MVYSTIILPMAASMESILLDVEKNVLGDYLSGIIEVGGSLAAACTAISMIGLGAEFLKGERFDWWKFCRPLLLLILVWNFSTMVLNPIRGLAGVFNTKLAATTGASAEDFKATYKEKAEEMCHENFGADGDQWEVEEDDNWFIRTCKNIGNKIVKGFFNLNESINLGASSLVSGLMFFFINLSASVMTIISHMCLMLMAIIGPFTFALAILKPFQKNMVDWIAKYLQFTLWQPLLYCVMLIGTEILVQGNQGASWGAFWTWVYMCLAIFTMIKMVPTFATYIIGGHGTDTAGNQMSGIGGQMLQKASSTAMILR